MDLTTDEAHSDALTQGKSWRIRLAAIKLRPPRNPFRRRTSVSTPRVLPEYVDPNARWRRGIGRLMIPSLVLFHLVAGFWFALLAPVLIKPFGIPILILLVLIIWALPDMRRPPTIPMMGLFQAFIVCLVLWPNYIAIALPGLPWITLLRLTGIPMAIFLMVSLSVSKSFREDVVNTLNATPLLGRLLLGFAAMMFITIPLSHDIGRTFQRIFVALVNWAAIYVVAAYTFRRPGSIRPFFLMMLAISIPIIFVSALEFRQGRVLWAGHLPSWFKVADDYMGATMRAFTDRYRAKGTFSTALGLAEYISLMTPVALHLAVTERQWLLRAAAALCLPACFYVVVLTDCRLGMAGMGIALVAYPFLWAVDRWRKAPSDLIAPALVLAYPAIAAAALASTFFVGRIRREVWGGGETAASTAARATQWELAFKKLASNPLGHGQGLSGETLGFTSPTGMITVDSYYVTVLMDLGILGFVFFFGAIITAGLSAVAGVLSAGRKDSESHYLSPIAASLGIFLIIKAVFSQEDNHPIIFMMLGMLTAILYRNKLINR